ncbi:MAG: aminotransferase class V-fold PLP-dependent enzyme, partial [bacterium]
MNDSFETKRIIFRKYFPIIENNMWLNHAAHGPWSIRSLEAMRKYSETYCLGPMLDYTVCDAEIAKTRTLMASFLGASFEEIGFNYNTSLTLILFGRMIKWQPGDNMIVPDRCFPSIIMPARLFEQWGVERRMIKPVDGLIDENALLGAIDKKTKFMIVPLVNFLTGQRLDVKRISDECKRAGVFLAVDAIQGAGAIKIDVNNLGCHALCFGSPKWMFGPMGVGTFYIDHEILNDLLVPQAGMNSVVDPWNFFDYDQQFLNDCRRFECGCQMHLAHFGLNPNLEMFLDLGPENTEKYLLEL